MTEPATPSVVQNIQVLRAFAALFVIFVHLGPALAKLNTPTFGFGGVDLFFVISGFIMVHTTRHKRITPVDFFKNRVARVAPIYWVLTGCVFCLALAAPSLLQGTTADVVALIKSLFFIPFARPDGRVEPVLFVGWTLNYEMFFYLLFAISLSFPRYRQGVCFSGFVLLVLCLIGFVVRPRSVMGAFYTSPMVLEFGLGMAIGWWEPRALLRPPGRIVQLGALGLVALSMLTVVLAPALTRGLPSLLTSGVPAAIAVAGAVRLESWGVRARRGLVYDLGNASYSLYLTHAFVTQAFQKFAGRLSSPILLVVGIGAVILCACILGLGVHRWVEQPLSRAARRLLGVRALRPSAGAGLP